MNRSKRLNCNADELSQLLTGKLSTTAAAQLELHLSECNECARQLELMAAEKAAWEQAQSYLSEDEFDDGLELATLSELSSADSISRANGEHQILAREIQGWLDPTDDPLMMGRFAGYEIVGIIGHGGMGIVLKGLERSLNRYVAIKVLAPRLATNATARRRFAREAQAAAAVLHENVVAIHRVAEAHGLPFLVMPYFVGESLQQRIDRTGPLALQATLRIGVQIAQGLAAAHAQGLVHRDIKPANIMLEPGVERVQITDFGLARAVDDAALTMTGIIAGTPQYMSPEQASGAVVDARSDIFSLGCLLFACLTGSSPYRAKTSGETLLRLRQGRQTSLRELEPSLPAWVNDLLAGFLQTTPSNRFQSASQVAAILEQCVLHVQSPDNQLPKALSKSRWLTAWIVVALVVVVVGLTLLSAITWRNSPSPASNENQSISNEQPASPEKINPSQIDSSIDAIERDLTNFEIELQSLIGN